MAKQKTSIDWRKVIERKERAERKKKEDFVDGCIKALMPFFEYLYEQIPHKDHVHNCGHGGTGRIRSSMVGNNGQS